jgi:hypothetical protein
MMRSFLPSRLDLKSQEKTVQLQFKGTAFELCLFDRGNAVTRSVTVTAAQLRQVSIDLHPVDLALMKLLYEDRHVVIEAKKHVWIRIPDVIFLKLIDMAAAGQGHSIDLNSKRSNAF